ncbi:acylphosphatase [Nannocystis punicea]|uniref:acylphosphatase n=1 Tax=Nannocystis punicea TaxID=2995304 RepID=A0ABY7H2E3_9BACT|nr:acylphosphatase [Nannocystis poenicansa]WAS93398.1 acylphosphatase [Nannocystis poenicansa]
MGQELEVVQALVCVDGRVQGVYYRASAQARAQALGLRGWVRNLPDGRVELRAQGTRARVEALVEWCRKGPPSARVASVDVDWEPVDSEMPLSFIVLR